MKTRFELRVARTGACLAAALLVAFAPATNRVAATPPDGAPSGRNKPVVAFDPTRKEVVVFGGYGGEKFSSVLRDGWAWSEGRWRQIEPSAFPSRAAAGVASDRRRGRVVLFGGTDESGPCGDTLEWDGKAWKRVATAGPSARTAPQLAYDARRGRTVLFGGWDDEKQRTLGDTWEWDGVQWAKLSDAGPPPRYHHVMVYDAARGKVVLFGGNSASGPYSAEAWVRGLLADTWEWDGTKWARGADGPPRRDHHAMAYDEARSKVVLFGGWDGAKFLGDLWEWDGAWRQVDARGPSARGGLPSMVYVPSQNVLLYGGWSDAGAETDVWRWDGGSWTKLG